MASKEDKIKSNHEAAIAAALAIVSSLTGDKQLLDKAKSAVENTISRQHPDGWFPEIGAADLGYCSVLLDYCMLYMHFSNDTQVVEPMKKLLNFMVPHIQPNATVSEMAGICQNPYLSRLGLSLLAKHSMQAKNLIEFLKTSASKNLACYRQLLMICDFADGPTYL